MIQDLSGSWCIKGTDKSTLWSWTAQARIQDFLIGWGGGGVDDTVGHLTMRWVQVNML